MVKYTTEQMKEMIKKEKEKYEKEKKIRDKKMEEKALKKELRGLKYKRFKGKAEGTISGIKKFGSTLGGLADRIELTQANVGIGSIVKITSGQYEGINMKILATIPGGIQGKIQGNVTRIRHGSYKRL